MNLKILLTLVAIIILVVGLFYVFFSKNSELEMPIIEDDARVQGVIIKEPMVGKKDMVIEGEFDYFFEVNDEEWYYIDVDESVVTTDMLDAFEGQSVVVEGERKEGQWDSDDPEVASRVGSYIVIDNIVK